MTTETPTWQRLDAALIEAFDADMADLEDDALSLETIQIGDTWTPDTWTLPALLLVSNDAEQVSAQHGGGGYSHVQITYSYYAVAVAQSTTHNAAKQAAQELNRRMLDVLRQWGDILQAAREDGPTDPEIPIRLLLGRSLLQVRGRQGASAGKWYGIASIEFEIETQK